MLVRITKQYNSTSEKSGIIEVDKIEFDSVDAAATWVTRVNANKNIGFDVIDYEAALINTGQSSSEIISNPTGGITGKSNKL